LLFEVIKKVII